MHAVQQLSSGGPIRRRSLDLPSSRHPYASGPPLSAPLPARSLSLAFAQEDAHPITDVHFLPDALPEFDMHRTGQIDEFEGMDLFFPPTTSTFDPLFSSSAYTVAARPPAFRDRLQQLWPIRPGNYSSFSAYTSCIISILIDPNP